MEYTNSTVWTPELWKTFVSTIFSLKDSITEDLVRQFLKDLGMDYDTEAAKVATMTDAEILALIR